MSTVYVFALNPVEQVTRRWSTWIDNLDNKQKSRLAGKLIVSFGSKRALFIQEDIRLTNVVVGIKNEFFLPKQLPKVCFHGSRNSSLFVLLVLILPPVSFWLTSKELALLHSGDVVTEAKLVGTALAPLHSLSLLPR